MHRRKFERMQDAAEVSRRKRRSSRAVLAGISLIATAVTLSLWPFAPPITTTVGAVTGFALVMYGVHIGWLVFYDRESDGPSS